MKSLALPVGECKMICNKALAERRCLLTQPWQNRAQYICAGGVLCAPYLIRHKAMRVHLESVCVCVCVSDALHPVFTYKLQYSVQTCPRYI